MNFIPQTCNVADVKPESVLSQRTLGGVASKAGIALINVAALEDHLMQNFGVHFNGEYGAGTLEEWMKFHDSVFYYARPNETFNEYEGLKLAVAAGKKYLLMENMS